MLHYFLFAKDQEWQKWWELLSDENGEIIIFLISSDGTPHSYFEDFSFDFRFIYFNNKLNLDNSMIIT